MSQLSPDIKSSTYKVATPIYEGPLDLLLQLIERAELDITKLALSEVTEQFLSHIKKLKAHSPEEISIFLVMASRLMQIKSEALLPRPPEREAGEEDPADALIQQIMLYKRYKEISQFLSGREENRLRTYLRLASPPKVEGKLDLSNVTIHDLAQAARQAYLRSKLISPMASVVKKPKITIREKIILISKILRNNKKSSFNKLLPENPNRTDIVVTFLAMLELIKRFVIKANQTTRFGEIELEQVEDADTYPDFDIEFSE